MRTLGVMYDILCFMFAKQANLNNLKQANVRPQVKCAVRRVTVDGHFNLPKGFVWVCMGKHTHFITQEGTSSRASQMHDSQLYFCVNSRQ